MSESQRLADFDNSWYNPGAGFLKKTIWYFMNAIFFNSFFPINAIKVFLLKLFGAQIGKGVILKPFVSIKYPWKLTIGNHVWIGEKVWIDNLDEVIIEDNVCVSQGALLLCGNHNYKKSTFDLMIGKIILKEGSWIGAKSIVTSNVTVAENSILQIGSVASQNLEKNSIYRGNPAIKIKNRF
jgi:putative colanic acid biosynthesis acetyltransferase WcaF